MKKYIGFIIILTLTYTCVYSQIAEYTSNELLVKMKPQKTSIQKANLKSQMNAHSIKTLPQTDVEVWQLDNSQDVQQVIAQYRYHPDIEFVEPNYIYSIHTNTPNDPDYDKLWGLHNTGQNGGTSDVDIDAPEAWNITTGSDSVAVAVIDTGIDWKHEDLAENIWQNLAEDADGDGHVLEWLNGEWAFDPGDENGIDDDGNGYVDDFIGWDFANNDNDPSDGNSHGTHVAGILGAKGNNAVGITGIAQNVRLAALKYLDDEGFGYADDAVAALNYAVDMDIPISNNSWGGGGYSTPFYQALRNAELNGHLFVAAAGNNGNNNDAFPTFPASYDVENVISVANIDRNDALNPTSNFGINSVHIAAPGTQIWSCLPLNGYGYKSGTSMAAPLVAGACALLWSEHPDRSYGAVKTAILNSATQTDMLEGKCVSGGRLNVYDAFETGVPPEPEPDCSGDSQAISEVYRALVGDENFEMFFAGRPMSLWHGLTLNENGCVTGIYTGDIPLNVSDISPYQGPGYISSDIVNLQELRSLSLVHTYLEIADSHYSSFEVFNGVLPGFLSELPKLQSLTVKRLYGGLVLQSGIDSLGITHLDLSDCRVENSTFPTDFTGFPNLRSLDLSDNELTQIPAFIGELDHLNVLYLNDNHLTGCYEGLSHLCNTLVNDGNERISGGNNFDVAWSEFCGSGAIVCNGYSTCRAADSLNLVAIYNATNGPNWTNTWNLDQPIDTWYGVTLSSAGCVNELNLADNQLTGDIPVEIANLSRLERLYLDNNELTGLIPAELGNLTNLLTLTLAHNQLEGCYSSNLWDLRYSLTSISNAAVSDGNNFDATWWQFCASGDYTLRRGACPDYSLDRQRDSLVLAALYHATDGPNWTNTWNLQNPVHTWHGLEWFWEGSLKELNLSNNQLNGTIPPEIAYLRKLNGLYLNNNQIYGTIPSEIGYLEKLDYLYLNDNQLIGSIPNELSLLTSLNILYLNNNQLSGCYDNGLQGLCNINYLNEISINEGNDFDEEWSVFCTTQSGMCVPEGCRERDSLSLVAFYNQTGGESWTNTWDLSQALNEWYGVTLDGNGCVHTLILENNQLSGNIPVELGNLSELTQLKINGNQLTGNIPPELGQLTELQTFYVQNNQLIGCFDTELLGLCDATVSVGGNYFTTNWSGFCDNLYGMCSGFGTCRERDSLALVEIYHQTDGENWVRTWDIHQPIDTWPGVFMSIEGCVTSLHLWNNNLNGTLPTAIGDLTELEFINLSYNNLTDSIPESIGNLNQLIDLNLSHNALSGNIPESIGDLSRLRTLYLGNNQFNGNIPYSIGNLTKLTHLSLWGNQLTGSIPSSIANIDLLTYFSVSHNQLSGCFPAELRNAYWEVFEFYEQAELYGYGYYYFVHVEWYIDNGNSFSPSWNDFLGTGEGACDTVWPGDFNADGRIDKSDVLYWGLAEGNTGSPRADSSSYWSAKNSSDWQQSVNGINSKHQDGNGDGTVDAQDLEVLVENYGNTHTFNPQNYIASGIEYRLEPLSDTTDAGNVILRYALYAEESGAPANVHGITCSIDFGELPAGNISIDTTGSSLQPQQQVGIFDAVENRLDLALTRTDKQDVICNGLVVVVEAIVAVKDLPSGETFTVQVTNNGSMMEANGTVNAASGMTVYDVFSFNNSEMLLTATAIHAECGTLGEAEISITGGVAPYSIWWDTGETTAQITNLTPEKYTATVTDAVGNEKTLEVEIQGQYIPSYGEAGNVLDCHIVAARIQPELCVLLEGAYSDSTGLMAASLLSLDVLPDRQPYHEAPWNYAGTEGLNWQTGDYPVGMIDWLLVSFRTQATADTQVGEVAAILLEDGCLHFTDDYVSLTQNVDSLYVVIEHRNHAAVMTPHPIVLTGDVLTYDFRTNDSYRTSTSSGQKQLLDGNYAMYVGDCDQSDANGYDINGQDKALWEPLNGTFGTYDIPDFNLDGDVNGADKALWFMNNGISSIVPK